MMREDDTYGILLGAESDTRPHDRKKNVEIFDLDRRDSRTDTPFFSEVDPGVFCNWMVNAKEIQGTGEMHVTEDDGDWTDISMSIVLKAVALTGPNRFGPYVYLDKGTSMNRDVYDADESADVFSLFDSRRLDLHREPSVEGIFHALGYRYELTYEYSETRKQGSETTSTSDSGLDKDVTPVVGVTRSMGGGRYEYYLRPHNIFDGFIYGSQYFSYAVAKNISRKTIKANYYHDFSTWNISGESTINITKTFL